MTEKIEWYREVLELEPNSKVFFPLAKLLAKDEEVDNAIETLEKGLERHPEFLEARLFLIELLYSTHQRHKLDAEIERLSAMFASYAGFWQAWAACLDSEKAGADTASILRFLAASFMGAPLQLRDVFNKGIKSIMEERAAHHAKPVVIDKGEAGGKVNSSLEAPLAMANPLDSESSANESKSHSNELEPQTSNLKAQLPDNALTADEPPVQEHDIDDDSGSIQIDASGESGEASGPEPAQVDVEITNAAPLSGDLPGMESGELTPLEVDEANVKAEPEEVRIVEQVQDEAELPPATSAQADLPAVEPQIVVEDMENIDAGGYKQDDAHAKERLVMESDGGDLAEAELLDQMSTTNAGIAHHESRAEFDLSNIPLMEDMALPEEEAPGAALPLVEQMAIPDPVAEAQSGVEEITGEGDHGEILMRAAQDAADALEEVEAEMPSQSPPDSRLERLEEDGNGGETFSLRTRSMADVLAEQGDVAGALDIYRELLAAAAPEEAGELKQRIASLEEKFAAPVEANPDVSNKEKLIDMLEALARRVEERVKNPVELS